MGWWVPQHQSSLSAGKVEVKTQNMQRKKPMWHDLIDLFLTRFYSMSSGKACGGASPGPLASSALVAVSCLLPGTLAVVEAQARCDRFVAPDRVLYLMPPVCATEKLVDIAGLLVTIRRAFLGAPLFVAFSFQQSLGLFYQTPSHHTARSLQEKASFGLRDVAHIWAVYVSASV